MLRFRRWKEHNGRVGRLILRKRAERSGHVDAPISLQRILLVTHLDEDFEKFAALVGGRAAETMLVRALQYAAEYDGNEGKLHVARARFGPVCLSRKWDFVKNRVGAVVYDALVQSRICVPCDCPRCQASEPETAKTGMPAGAPAVPPTGATEGEPAGAHSFDLLLQITPTGGRCATEGDDMRAQLLRTYRDSDDPDERRRAAEALTRLLNGSNQGGC